MDVIPHSFFQVFPELSRQKMSFSQSDDYQFKVSFEDFQLGTWDYQDEISDEDKREVSSSLASLLLPNKLGLINQEIFNWVFSAREKYPHLFDWIGVYFKESFYLGIENSTDLVLGPYIGEATDHIRIPISEGLCGLALREERVVNVEDVHADDRHIACSLSTRSELIIPIVDKNGNFIAELDIDSNSPAAFSSDIQRDMEDFAKTFPLS